MACRISELVLECHDPGVVYSHRSTWLHSQAACISNAFLLIIGIGVEPNVDLAAAADLRPRRRRPCR
ncbi:hypothetical protein ACVWY6_004804 [Williamsia sp. R60]